MIPSGESKEQRRRLWLRRKGWKTRAARFLAPEGVPQTQNIGVVGDYFDKREDVVSLEEVLSQVN